MRGEGALLTCGEFFLHEVVFLALQGAMNDVFPRRSCFVSKQMLHVILGRILMGLVTPAMRTSASGMCVMDWSAPRWMPTFAAVFSGSVMYSAMEGEASRQAVETQEQHCACKRGGESGRARELTICQLLFIPLVVPKQHLRGI